MVSEPKPISLIQKFGKDIFKYLPSKAVPALIGLLAIPVITKLFEPQDYGNYMLVMATVGLLSLIPGSLLGTSVVRFFAAYREQDKLEHFYNTLIKGTIACVGGITIIFFGILQLVRTAITLELYHLMSIGALLFILTSISDILLYLLNAKQKAKVYSCFSIWRVGGRLVFGLAIVLLLKQGVEGLLWGAIGAFAIAFPFLFYAAFGRVSREGTFSKSIAIEMAKYGGPLVIVSLVAWILSLSDRYIIGLYRGSYEIGLYSASYNFCEQTITMLWSAFALAGYPLIVNIWETQGKEAAEDLVGKLTRYYILIGFPAAVGMSILAKPIIGIFTASAYHEGYRIVPLVVFGSFLLRLQWWVQVGLALYKKTYIISSAVLGAGILNVGLNFLFVPKYGYMSAAATTFISYAFLLGLMIFASRRFFIWQFPFKSLAKITCASAFMGIATHFGGNSLKSSYLINLLSGIGIGVIVYILMLFLLQEPQKREIQSLSELGAKILGRMSR